MQDRLPTGILVSALIRRVHDAGGSAMVLSKGDAMGGMVLALTLNRGAEPRFWERGIGPDGKATVIETGPRDSAEEAATEYWRRRVSRDPDLWVIELDVPEAERFVAETISTS